MHIIVDGQGNALSHVESAPKFALTAPKGAKRWYKAATLMRPIPGPLQRLSNPVYDVANGTITYSLVEWSDTEKVNAIKGECGRRILEQYPDWYQRNMIAKATTLQEKRIDGGALTTTETAEAAALNAAWAWVDSMRAKSNELEASPPADPFADSHWPAAP